MNEHVSEPEISLSYINVSLPHPCPQHNPVNNQIYLLAHLKFSNPNYCDFFMETLIKYTLKYSLILLIGVISNHFCGSENAKCDHQWGGGGGGASIRN